MLALSVIKDLLRGGKYAWPGGYPMYFIAGDGEALSFEAVHAEWRQVVRALLWNTPRDQWAIVGYDVNWEDDNLHCAHTGEKIEAAYSESPS